MVNAPAATAYLIPLSGPPIRTFELIARPAGLLMGRHEDCDLRLPPDAEKVSRFHARFSYDGQQWRISDARSRWGTFLNGVRLAEGREVPLNEGDLVRLTPWTFTFTTSASRRGLESYNDINEMQTFVRSVSAEAAAPLADDLLTLLLEAAAGIHAAEDEKALARIVLEEACRGTGLPNGALLRPLDADGHIEVVATRGQRREGRGSALYSRSLLAAASKGVLAELADANSFDPHPAHSIVQMQINAALCVPLMLGNTIAAYLYLDSRGNGGPSTRQTLRPNAAAFCLALARMASLALANLKRIDIERRQALIDAEIAAAGAAQKWILPKRDLTFAHCRCIGESRPGQVLGGDFFDIIPLDEHRLAVALGDVTGKGIVASVLMTAAQGFLHAALRETASADLAVRDLNRYVCPRRPESRFVTLWVGIFDFQNRRLSYVDAGHGYAMLARPDGAITPIDSGDNLPVGVEADAAYVAHTIDLPPAGQALIVSDGIIEQFGTPAGSSAPVQFELEGVRRTFTQHVTHHDIVAALFDAVIQHAGTPHLADDATAVLVRW